jgi:hypothetical protein
MTTATMNALNASAVRSASQFRQPSFLEVRAALPDMPRDMATQGGFAARAASVAARAALAAVPFGAIGWMFLAH